MENEKLIEKEVGAKITNTFEDGRGTIYEFDNGEEWLIFDSYEEAERSCIDYVYDQLENEPELFNQEWLKNYIDKGHLKDVIYSDVYDGNWGYWSDISDKSSNSYQNRQIEELVDGGYLDEEDVFDKNGELIDEIDETKLNGAIEKAVEESTDDNLEDPIQYLQDLYGDEDGIKKAMELGGIDTSEASEEAVNIDGVAHFFATYDGEQVELQDGTVMYRVN